MTFSLTRRQDSRGDGGAGLHDAEAFAHEALEAGAPGNSGLGSLQPRGDWSAKAEGHVGKIQRKAVES